MFLQKLSTSINKFNSFGETSGFVLPLSFATTKNQKYQQILSNILFYSYTVTNDNGNLSVPLDNYL